VTFTAEWLRVYYNHGKDTTDKPWSVDCGPGTVELLAARIDLEGVRGQAVTISTEGQPRAWLKLYGVKVTCEKDAVIKIESSSYFK
jgi:hypothetical protein